jgi:uncharacterized protein
MHFVLIYDVVDNFTDRRTPYRPQHLQLAKDANARGELEMAGALGDPVTRALLVFRAEDRSVPENFAKADPYVVNGLVARWEVHPWHVVVGADQ